MPTGDASSDLVRQLAIKLGTCKRYKKELEYYQKEWDTQSSKLESMEENITNCCPHDVAKQKEILQETEMLLPGCKERLQSAGKDLEGFLARHSVQDFQSSLSSYEEAHQLVETLSRSQSK